MLKILNSLSDDEKLVLLDQVHDYYINSAQISKTVVHPTFSLDDESVVPDPSLPLYWKAKEAWGTCSEDWSEDWENATPIHWDPLKGWVEGEKDDSSSLREFFHKSPKKEER